MHWCFNLGPAVCLACLLLGLFPTCLESRQLRSSSSPRALYSGYYGGSHWEEKLETPIDLREPRSFEQSGLLVVRQEPFKTLTTVSKGAINVSNWEVYTENWWYETREVNATCPMVPIGIAATTDWSLMCLCLFGNPDVLPKTIFVHTLMLPHFIESTLNFMNETARFILISAGMDLTLPFGTGDIRREYRHRVRGFGGDNGGLAFQTIVNDPRVMHWYAENRDTEHPKLSTLPTGYTIEMIHRENKSYVSYEYENKENLKLPLLQRPLTVLTADRLRDKVGQWADRYNVERMCESADWCSVPFENLVEKEGIDHGKFIQQLHLHSFVTCVHGGGLDPSPKAFEAIHEGTIPILRKSYVHDAYSHLPVAWVDNWSDFFQAKNATAILQHWREKLAPYYEPNSALRHATLNKLRTSYWRELMDKKYSELITKEVTNSAPRSKRKLLRASRR